MAKQKSNEPISLQSRMRDIMKDKKFGGVYVGRDAIEERFRVRGAISTGCLPLNLIIDPKHLGLTFGCISEVLGETSTGKSTIGESYLIQCQRMVHTISDGRQFLGFPILVKFEGDFHEDRFKALGGDVDNLTVIIVRSIEEAGEKLIGLLYTIWDRAGTNEIPIGVDVDSVAAARTLSEVEDVGDWDLGPVGAQARWLSANIPRIVAIIEETNTHLLCINQMRMAVNTDARAAKFDKIAGRDKTSPGGKALGYYASVRILVTDLPEHITRTKDESKRDLVYNPLGRVMVAQTIKNKLAGGYRKAVIPMYDAYGIDDLESWLHFLENREFIKHVSGGKYKLTLGSGKDAPAFEFFRTEGFKRMLVQEPDFRKEVEEFILAQGREEMSVKPVGGAPDEQVALWTGKDDGGRVTRAPVQEEPPAPLPEIPDLVGGALADLLKPAGAVAAPAVEAAAAVETPAATETPAPAPTRGRRKAKED